MRKLLPWALLGVLGVGVAVAAVVGQVQSPAASSTNWLANLVATTAVAGSAHLRISSVALSADPSERSSSVATGVIDFTTGNFRFNQLNHEVSFASTNGGAPRSVPYNWGETQIAIGQSLFEKDFVTESGTLNVLPTTWNKYINPRDVHQAFGLDAGTAAENAVSGLSGILPVTSTRSLGPATVHGVATTRYVVTYGAPELCASGSANLVVPARGAGSRGSIAHAVKAIEPRIGPTTLWVDGQGRLAQVRASTFTSAHDLKSLGTTYTASQTNVTTLTFFDFGAPVHIVAPDFTGPQPRSFSVGGTTSTTCAH